MGAFFSKKKKAYDRIDQSFLLDNLNDIRDDVLNKRAVTTTDFTHAIQLLESQIAELRQVVKEQESKHEKELAQIKLEQATSLAAVYSDLKRLMDNDSILDRKLQSLTK